LVHASSTLITISSIDNLLVFIPVIYVFLTSFKRDKVPAPNVMTFLIFIDAVATTILSFFTFIVYAQSSSDSGLSSVAAIASGCFFVFLGEGVMAFALFAAI